VGGLKEHLLLDELERELKISKNKKTRETKSNSEEDFGLGDFAGAKEGLSRQEEKKQSRRSLL